MNEYPRWGEVWYAKNSNPTGCHDYVGVHPYLVVSNNKYNDKAGTVNAIPFTSKRFGNWSPAHVDFSVEEASKIGLKKESTLMCENEISIKVSDFINKVGKLSDEQLEKAAYSMILQKPFIAFAFSSDIKQSDLYKTLANY